MIVICDRKLVRDAMVRSITAAKLAVLTEGHETVELWRPVDREDRPIVILYWRDGLQKYPDIRYAIASIISQSPRAKIVIVSEVHEMSLIRQAHKAGAKAFVGVNLIFNLLITILQIVAFGRLYFPYELLLESRQKISATPGKYSFTRRQREIIDCIMKGMSNEQIAVHFGLTTRSVTGHVGRILKTVGARNRVELIHRLKGPWLL